MFGKQKQLLVCQLKFSPFPSHGQRIPINQNFHVLASQFFVLMRHFRQIHCSLIEQTSLPLEFCIQSGNIIHKFPDNILILLITLFQLIILLFVLLQFLLITGMRGYLISQELPFSALVVRYYSIEQSFEDFYQQIPYLFQKICLLGALRCDFFNEFGEVVNQKSLFVPKQLRFMKIFEILKPLRKHFQLLPQSFELIPFFISLGHLGHIPRFPSEKIRHGFLCLRGKRCKFESESWCVDQMILQRRRPAPIAQNCRNALLLYPLCQLYEQVFSIFLYFHVIKVLEVKGNRKSKRLFGFFSLSTKVLGKQFWVRRKASLHVDRILFSNYFLKAKERSRVVTCNPKKPTHQFPQSPPQKMIIPQTHHLQSSYLLCFLPLGPPNIYISFQTTTTHNQSSLFFLPQKQIETSNDKATAQKSYCRVDLQPALVHSLLSDHFKQIENIFVFVLDIPLFKVHLPFVQQIVHVLMPQIPLQKPAKDALQSQLLFISTCQQLLQVSQTDHYFLQNRLYEFHELFVGNPLLFATFPQNFFIISGEHFADTAFDHVDCDIFLIVILKILLQGCSVGTERLICFWNLLLFLCVVVPSQCDLKRFLGKDLSFFDILEKVGALYQYECRQEICFICIH